MAVALISFVRLLILAATLFDVPVKGSFAVLVVGVVIDV